MRLLSISNIAWSSEHDIQMYAFMHTNGYLGLEIAPTRIFSNLPYDHIDQARHFSTRLYEEYGLSISSMQSIWYGRNENIFGTQNERDGLFEYTKRAIDFADAIDCKNLVFGCPKNRSYPQSIIDPIDIAVDFFSKIAEYAAEHHTIIAFEANPPLYGTNFINTTQQAITLCHKVNLKGFKINVDVGTMIANDESISIIADNIDIVSHIHISEPQIAPIKHRSLHQKIFALPYTKYISIEMRKLEGLESIKQAALYIKGLAVMEGKD